MNYYTRIYKGVKPCPCCGGVSYYNVVSGSEFACQCSECGLIGQKIDLPCYWGKGSKRLLGRMFMRALKSWNERT